MLYSITNKWKANFLKFYRKTLNKDVSWRKGWIKWKEKITKRYYKGLAAQGLFCTTTSLHTIHSLSAPECEKQSGNKKKEKYR